ncbi:hypothetical protein GCM10010199_58110 [Dactylosporangium roseum]
MPLSVDRFALGEASAGWAIRKPGRFGYEVAGVYDVDRHAWQRDASHGAVIASAVSIEAQARQSQAVIPLAKSVADLVGE